LDLIAGDYKNMGCRGEFTSGVAKGIDACGMTDRLWGIYDIVATLKNWESQS
jgi:hypothetical protein